MKIALIGFLMFTGWSAGSTYVYVCLLKGLCEEQVDEQALPIRPEQKHLDKPILEASIPSDQTIYFAFDKWDFDADATTDRYIVRSAEYLNEHPSAQLILVGHTDERGTEAYNLTLGQLRAERIMEYAQNKGLTLGQITSTSKGEMELADTAKTKMGHSHNRRVSLTIKQ
jgi:outer membrane protein OmpA-like peptidoglycan-associated protein